MDLLRELTWGAALPAGVAAVLWIALGFRRGAAAAGGAPAPARAGGSVAVAAGFLAGYLGLLGSFPTFPPGSAADGIPYLVAACGLLGLAAPLASSGRLAAPFRWVAPAAAAAFLFRTM